MKKVIAIFMSLAILIGSTGCSANTPEKAVKSFFSDAKKFSEEKFGENYDEAYKELIELAGELGLTKEEANEIYKNIISNVKYEIVKVEEEAVEKEKEEANNGEEDDISKVESFATAKIKITNVDLEEAMDEYMNEYLTIMFSEDGASDEELSKKSSELFKKVIKSGIEKGKEKTWECDMELVKLDGKWQAIESYEVINALTGGVFEDDSEEGDEDEVEEDEIIIDEEDLK